MTTRLNHVAFSVDASLMDEVGRQTLINFYSQVFGWREGDNTGETGNPLIMYTGGFGEFIYLLPADPFLTAPRLDHFGVQVNELEELHTIVQRAQYFAQSDARVEIIDVHSRTTHGPQHDYTLTSAYIGFVIPLMIEIQHLARVPRD